MLAICNPKQIPKNGMLFSRAYFADKILPSIPLSPKPPGMSIEDEFFKVS